MKRLTLLVSLVLFSFFPPIDNQKEQPYLANTDRTLSLSCPDYLPPKLNINETTDINKSDAATGNISSDWYSKAIKNIRQEEYNISYCEETGALQSPNRANNILFTYNKNGFTAKTMQTKIPLFDVNDRSLTDKDKKHKELDAWSVELKIKNYELGIMSAELASAGNKAWIENDNVRIDYTNTRDGMRQDFVIKEKPLHDLSLQIDVITKLNVSVNKNSVTFSSTDGTEQLQYSSLKAWDADGKEFAAYFEILNSDRLAIRVDDRDAVYPVTIDPLSSTPDWVKESNGIAAAFGICVSTAGDVNGDGYDDVIIGAHMFSGELVNQGKAYLFYGSAVGLNSEPAWTALGTSEYRFLGWNVSCAGDVNNDGYSDVLIVSGMDFPSEYSFGAVYAYYGSASGLSSVPDWTGNFIHSLYTVAAGAGDINGDGYDDIIFSRPKVGPHGNGFVYLNYGSATGIEINQAWSYANTRAGRGLSSAGDVNGDGYGDIIMSAYWEAPLMEHEDKSILFLGSAEGFSQNPAWSKSNCYGESVSGGGDINGDGYDDVIIGDGQCSPGAVYIHYGSATGISTDADRTITGSDPNARFGSSVSNAGDINADGFSDIIIGARNDEDTGKAFVYYGSDSGPVESTMQVFQSDQINDQFGADVSSAGDVNNDGFSDVMIGAPNYSNGESGEGRVLVYYGSANLTPPVIINLSPHQNAIDVSKSSDITVAFGENMNSSTINNSNIKVYGSLSGYKNCLITYDAFQKKAMINPDFDFKTGEDITVTLTSGIQSYSGISLAPFVYQFTAEATGGTGIFTEVSVIDSTLPYPTSITAGDVDQDGDIDLLIGKGSSIKIYKNNGEGIFSEFSEINEIGFIKTGDIDNDGDLDFIQSNEGILKTFLNDGNGIFTYHNTGYGSAGELADFDGDGDIDIAYNGIYSLSSNLNIITEKNNNGVFSVDTPEELNIIPGQTTTLRGVLGSSLGYMNKLTNGALIGVAADLIGSTSVNLLGSGFHEGFFDAVDNPDSRILAVGGICEDAIGGMMAGLSAYGKHIGVSSSYGAFISAMEHTAARLHGIGEQNRIMHFGGHYKTWILINAHAGLKTGEDGPTHADPQCLQLIQENFPPGILITLTPWEPGEIWPLLVAGLKQRPAILSPFVTRPNELIIDREKFNLAPATESVKGVYALRKADPDRHIDGSVILQESGVTLEFITKVLPRLDEEGYNINVYHVSSAELYDAHPKEEREALLPYTVRRSALGITGFTLPTMYKWVTGFESRYRILHPFRKGYYLGSGTAESVLHQAGLDAESIYEEVLKYIHANTKIEELQI